MEAKAGNLIDTFFLYSEQAPVLLRQALEREQAEGKRATETETHNKRLTYQPDSSEESEGEEAVESPSSSSDEEDGQDEKTEEAAGTGKATTGDQPSDDAPTSLVNPASKPTTKKKKKPPKPTQTEQQRQHTVKKLVENLTCDILPIHDTEALHLPTALLAKPDDSAIAERNYVAKSACQEFLDLSRKLQQSERESNNVLVILLRSGRFAAGIFRGSKCLVHRACQRYTIRGGQGKAQSTQDASRRPKSVGSQLRRQGEEALQQDIQQIIEQWKSYIAADKTSLILLSCPKNMRKYLFDAIDPTLIPKNDTRIRRLPLDIGRPTFENVCIAHQVMMTVQLKHWAVGNNNNDTAGEKGTAATTTTSPTQPPQAKASPTTKEPDIVFPLTPLHEACQKGDLEALNNLLDDPQQLIDCQNEHGDTIQLSVETMIQRRVGPDFMTCLHCAAAAAAASEKDVVEAETAATCVSQLLLQGKANPAVVDARHRPPYFVASHDKIRDAFRLARAQLGEDYCKWDTVAKVGPPLTEADIEAKKEREAEKKRKKRARQKQKKAQEKAQAAADEKQRQDAEEERQKQEAAKRVRDGLQPKQQATGGSVCDFCQTVVKGRKRKDMFSRLDYVYCSAECVQKHKRELMAAAALSRFGG